jgi:hypothetical protein
MRCGTRYRGSWCVLVRYRDLYAVIEQAAAMEDFMGVNDMRLFMALAAAHGRGNVFAGQAVDVDVDGRVTVDVLRLLVNSRD